MLPESFGVFLLVFENCFTAPSDQRFLTLINGGLLCTGKHTMTGVMRAAGVVGKREHSGYHRFFSQGAWEPDAVGMALLTLALKAFPKDEVVKLTIDDTLGRHTGKLISSASMHRDPLLSTESSDHDPQIRTVLISGSQDCGSVFGFKLIGRKVT